MSCVIQWLDVFVLTLTCFSSSNNIFVFLINFRLPITTCSLLQEVWTEHPLTQHVLMRAMCHHMHWTEWSHFITRTRAAHKLKNARVGVLQQLQSTCHVPFFCRTLTLTTSTSSSHFSPIFPTSSPSHPFPLVRDQYLFCENPRTEWRINTNPISCRLWAKKLIESEDLQPRRIEFDRNLGTDPCQTQERFMGNNFQNPMSEDMGEFGKVGVEMSYIQSQITLRLWLSRKYCRLAFWRWRITKNIDFTAFIGGEEILNLLENLQASGKPWISNNTEERRKSTTCWSLKKRKLDVKFISRADSVRETGCKRFQQRARNREISSRVQFLNSLTHQIWKDLFLKTIKIICSARKDLNEWNKNTKLDLSIIVSVSFSNNLVLEDWNFRRIIYGRKFTSEVWNWLKEKKARELRVDEFSVQKKKKIIRQFRSSLFSSGEFQEVE